MKYFGLILYTYEILWFNSIYLQNSLVQFCILKKYSTIWEDSENRWQDNIGSPVESLHYIIYFKNILVLLECPSLYIYGILWFEWNVLDYYTLMRYSSVVIPALWNVLQYILTRYSSVSGMSSMDLIPEDTTHTGVLPNSVRSELTSMPKRSEIQS